MGGRGEEYRNCRRMAINTGTSSTEGMYGGGSRLRRHVVKLCGKRLLFYERWTSSGQGRVLQFVRVVNEGTGTINYLN